MKIRAVVDTNVIVSGLFWKGTPEKVLNALASDKFELLVSEEILTEYSRVLSRVAAKKAAHGYLAQSWIMWIVQNSILTKIKKKVKVCRDPFDDMFIDCALAGKASYIVSGDKDLLSLNQYMGIDIVDSKNFLSKL